MPRRRADKVIEHRLSLSDGLHKEMKKTLSANKITNQVAMAGNAGKAIMNVAAVGAIGAIAYLGVKAYAEAKGVMPQVKESFQKAWDWGFGVETNADGSIVPTTVTITNAYGNQETVVNPINSIPVLNKTPFVGGLFDWGMKLGAATNPFEGDPHKEYESTHTPWELEQMRLAAEAQRAADFERMKEEKSWENRDLVKEGYAPPVKVFEEAEGGGLGLDMGLDHLEDFRETAEAMADIDPLNPDHPTTPDFWAQWSQTMRSAGIEMYGTLDLNWSYAQYVTWWNENIGA